MVFGVKGLSWQGSLFLLWVLDGVVLVVYTWLLEYKSDGEVLSWIFLMAEVFVGVFIATEGQGGALLRVVPYYWSVVGNGDIFFSLGPFLGDGIWGDIVVLSLHGCAIFLLAGFTVVLEVERLSFQESSIGMVIFLESFFRLRS